MYQEEMFTFMWSVRNFSMCPVSVGKCIRSPIIAVSELGNSEWTLCLYPTGLKTMEHLACLLKCKGLGIHENFVTVKFTLSVFTSEKTTEHNFALNGEWGFSNLISMGDILRDNQYLLNDTLTIFCYMKCTNYISLKNIKEEILEAENREFRILRKDQTYLDSCFIQTTVQVETKSVTWTILNFMSLSNRKRLTLPVILAMREIPSFYVTLYKNADLIHVEIRREETEIFKRTFVKCVASAIGSEKEVKYCTQDEILFESEDEVWNFPVFLKPSDLAKDGYFESTDGMLCLKFDFSFSIDGRLHHSEKSLCFPEYIPTKSRLPENVFSMPTPDSHGNSIVTLRAQDQTFKAHKSVLTSRSEVFQAMFENPMKEQDTGVVEITDVAPNILDRMLKFLYSNTEEEDSIYAPDVLQLYSTAAKYQIKSLMSHCSDVLVSGLSISNVCDILDLADLHQDKIMLQSAREFVEINTDRVLVSQEWQNFMERRGTLAAKVMHKLLIKNYGGLADIGNTRPIRHPSVLLNL